jgi:hypothetical protein
MSNTLPNTIPNTINTNIMKQNKIDINQCFIPRKSRITSSNNISMFLESAKMPGLFITQKGPTFIMQKKASDTKTLMTQTFYIEKPQTIDKEQPGVLISIRTTDTTNPMYLAFENKQVKAYANTSVTQAQNNMTFMLNLVDFKTKLKIVSIYDGSVKTMTGNIIGILENNNKDGTTYYVIPSNMNGNNTSSNGGNFDILKDKFILQNSVKKTYVICDHESGFLYDREITQNRNGIFNIVEKNGYYTIVNSNKKNLVDVTIQSLSKKIGTIHIQILDAEENFHKEHLCRRG